MFVIGYVALIAPLGVTPDCLGWNTPDWLNELNIGLSSEGWVSAD